MPYKNESVSIGLFISMSYPENSLVLPLFVSLLIRSRCNASYKVRPS